MSDKGVCRKCQEKKALTRHHVFPKRWFHNKKRENNLYLNGLCRQCHDELENEIRQRERNDSVLIVLEKVQYVEIACDFIGQVPVEWNLNSNNFNLVAN